MDVPTEFGADAHIYRPALVRRVGIVQDRGAKRLKIRLPLKTDEAFDQWFATLPSLAQRHQQWRSGK
jgi:hypothetical protein